MRYKVAMRMADDEFLFLKETLEDEELARLIADSETDSAVALLLRSKFHLLAVMLWRNRTGDNLKTAMDAVERTAQQEAKGTTETP